MFDNPYHNWYHVVDVTQCVFALAHKVFFLLLLSSLELSGTMVYQP